MDKKHSRIQSVIAIALLPLLLAACATPSQRQAQNIRAVWSTAVAKGKACMTAAYEAPEAAPIRAKRPLDLREATLEQLNDKSLASDDEIKAEYATYPKFQACRRQIVDQLSSTTPTIASILSNEYHADDELLLALVNRQKTWGEYLTQAQSKAYAAIKELASEANRIDNDLRRSTQAELAQRQQAFMDLQSYLQNEQLINAMRQPTYTNCSAFGNSINCLSH